ncbi:MAG: hypothetical protein HY951_00965 [Bacteroidia bacterium]|nr:hypothetical protein [Bacteroidia bacterium]
MKEIQKNNLIFLVSLVILIFPYIYLSFYANPAADDFTYAHKEKALDFFSTLINEYLNWNGRYTSNVFVLINPIAFNSFLFYKLIPVFIIVLTFLSYLLFVKTLLSDIVSNIISYIISLLLTLLFIYQMPIISEGIYWYTGAVTYQLGNIFALILICLLWQFVKRKFIFGNSIIHLMILTLILISAIGFNEVLMLLILFFSFVFLFIQFKNKLENKNLAIYISIIALIFSLMVYLAPGNSIRESNFSNIHNLYHSVIYSIAQTGRFFVIWLSSVPLLLLSFLFFFLNKTLSSRLKIFSVSFYLSPVYSTLILFFILFISVFPAYWSTGMLGQHRTLNVAYYFFILFWFINLNVWFNYFENRLRNIRSPNKKVNIFVICIILGFLAFSRNGYSSLTDMIYGKASSFNKQMNERYDIIKSSKDTIFFKPIKNPSKCLLIYDISNNPEHWLNRCYTVYFNCENKTVVKD